MRPPFRHLIAPWAALLLVAASGCGGERAVLSAENDEPAYREGLQLKREGRYDEALAAYLKVIAKRGEDQAPESHLEVGLIELDQVKDPIAAIYHFRKYLELEPNSRQGPQVQGLIARAKRDFAATLPGRPLDGQPVVQAELDQIGVLQRENRDLREEIAALQAGAASAPTAPAPAPVGAASQLISGPPPLQAPPAADSSPAAGLVPEGDAQAPASAAAASAQAPAPPTRPAGRTHTVAKGDTLFSLAKHYYGSASVAKANAIYQANRDVMRSETDLKPGMQLKIP